MSEQLLPDHLTPITPEALYAALKAAAPRAVGCDLSRESLLVLLAQIDQETGFKAVHAWNLGNVKHVTGDGHDYVSFACTEVLMGVETWYYPPSQVTWFRAYASLEDGCVDYLALLKRRFNQAWPAVLAGDPAQFAHLLKVQHYYTADEAKYTANVVWLAKHLDSVIPQDPAPFTGANPAIFVDQPTPPEDMPPAA